MCYFRYNSLHFHAVSLDAGDRYKYINRNWYSVLRRRNGPQCLYLAEGKDNSIQLHETATAPNDADAAAS